MASIIEEIHLDDIGTVIEVTITDKNSDGTATVLDISSATVTELIFKKPSGTVVTQTAGFTTDGTDGKIQYITIAADIDEFGTWHLQARIVMPSGTWKSDVGHFVVASNL